ncbi:hypothetical protein [Nonomuraea insulae]|uniref:Uncharacterized protein n=1 Tax=Nonomuraea insulae TaxID=1616787 RepID=A0ABW1DDT9_9ACTN
MSNGARHALGVVAGLLLPPLLAAGLWYGTGELSLQAQQAFRVSWVALGVLAASAILLGFLAGSRLSPVASLFGGLSFTALGVLPYVEMATGVRVMPDAFLPSFLHTGFMTLTYSGLQFVIGLALLAVSTFPSRWRGRVAPAVGYQEPWDQASMQPQSPAQSSAQSPYLPPGIRPEDATRPMYRE